MVTQMQKICTLLVAMSALAIVSTIFPHTWSSQFVFKKHRLHHCVIIETIIFRMTIANYQTDSIAGTSHQGQSKHGNKKNRVSLNSEKRDVVAFVVLLIKCSS